MTRPLQVDTERIKSTVPIERVVKAYVHDLRTSGLGRWVGRCPFHVEDTPSFMVLERHGSRPPRYHCFGCGAHGDVIKFIQEIEGADFNKAVEILEKDFGADANRSPSADVLTKQQECIKWYTDQVEGIRLLAEAYQWALRQVDEDGYFELMADLVELVGPSVFHDDPEYLMDRELRNGGILGRLRSFGNNGYLIVAHFEMRDARRYLPPIMEANPLVYAQVVLRAYGKHIRGMLNQDIPQVMAGAAMAFDHLPKPDFDSFMRRVTREVQSGDRRDQGTTTGYSGGSPRGSQGRETGSEYNRQPAA